VKERFGNALGEKNLQAMKEAYERTKIF